MNAGLTVPKGAARYCCDLVRTYDRDRYRLILSQAPRHRETLFALFAFNHEIAKTREVVSEPTLGLIRLQWWREAIEKLFAGAPPAHEILTMLAPLAARLAPDDFIALIDAREADFETEALPSLTALEHYAERTSSPLSRLALRAMGQNDAGAGAVSTAYALTGLLRAQPFLAKRAFLPHGVTAADMARRAMDLLQPAPVSGFLRANAALARLYLHRIARGGYDLADARISLPPLGFSLAAFAGRYR